MRYLLERIWDKPKKVIATELVSKMLTDGKLLRYLEYISVIQTVDSKL